MEILKPGEYVFDLHKPAELKFDCSLTDVKLCIAIADRMVLFARSVHPPLSFEIDRMHVAMSVCAVHCNDRSLRLLAMLHSGPDDFLHDVAAIHRFLDGRTGKLFGGVKLHFEGAAR